MRSLSIVIGAKTALGRALLAAQDPAEIVICATGDEQEAVWLEKHYPWFPVLRCASAVPPLPYTNGPVRIYCCTSVPDSGLQEQAADYCQSLFCSIGLIRSIISRCGSHSVHIAFVSSIAALMPSIYAICAQAAEKKLSAFSNRNPGIRLSVFHPGKLIDRRSATSPIPFYHASHTRLARLMMRSAESEKSQRTVVGLDARILSMVAHVRAVLKEISAFAAECRPTAVSAVSHRTGKLHLLEGVAA